MNSKTRILHISEFVFWNVFRGICILESVFQNVYFRMCISEFASWNLCFRMCILESVFWNLYFGMCPRICVLECVFWNLYFRMCILEFASWNVGFGMCILESANTDSRICLLIQNLCFGILKAHFKIRIPKHTFCINKRILESVLADSSHQLEIKHPMIIFR